MRNIGNNKGNLDTLNYTDISGRFIDTKKKISNQELRLELRAKSEAKRGYYQ